MKNSFNIKKEKIYKFLSSQIGLGFLMFTIILLGLFLRIYGLSNKIVWHDEVTTRVLAAGGTINGLMNGLYNSKIFTIPEVLSYQQNRVNSGLIELITDLAERDPQHPPLYYLSAKIWTTVFGYSIYTLRLLSVTFSILSIVAMYWLVKELQGTRRSALISALLVSISPMLVLYSQDAREYSMWSLELIITSATFLRALRIHSLKEKNILKAWAPYIFICSCAMYTSFSTIALIFVQIVYIFLINRFRITNVVIWFLSSISIVGLLFLPWALNLMRNFEAFSVSMAWASVIVIPRTAILRIMSLNFSRNLFDFWPDIVQDQALPIVVSLAGLLFFISSIVWVSICQPRKARLYILSIVLLPISMLLLPDLLFGGIRSTNARYLMPVWIGIIAAASLMLGNNYAIKKNNLISTMILSAVILLAVSTNYLHSREIAPWTKSLSIKLPEVEYWINRSEDPLVIGNQERHHPGNLFALANLLRSDAKMQFIPINMEANWRLPQHTGIIYLYSPTDQFRHALEKNNNVRTKLLTEDLFLQLWQVESL